MGFFNRKEKTEQVKELTAYISGSVIPITEVNDPVFSSKALGDGIAIRPSEQTITAPCGGEISMAADTGHAIGITVNNGAELLLHIGITLFETFVSFFLVIAISLLSAILLWLIPGLSRILEPYLVMLNSLPKSALAPLLIVWLGASYKTIIITGISVAVFGSIMSLYTGFMEVDPEKIRLIYTLDGTKRHALYKVILPANIPNLSGIMKVNIGLCLVGVIIGEFIAARQGLGYLIIYGSQVFKMDWVILSILILCVIAMGLYLLLDRLEQRYCR